MLAIIGTVPDDSFPLTSCHPVADGGHLDLDGIKTPVNRGTPALIASALAAARAVGADTPKVFLVGDTGLGKGSRELYAHLEKHLPGDDADTLVFHYLQPDVDWHNKVLFAIQEMARRPRLVADAGFMYAAKMSGQACEYDLFTPDVGELAFLADETAPHPFYTRGFILQEEGKSPEFIRRAYEHGNASRHLLVKGGHDYVADSSGILGEVHAPSSPAMEAMGGTGDSLTGIVSVLVDAGLEIPRACMVAARANRLAGQACDPTPATQILEVIEHIPHALERALDELP